MKKKTAELTGVALDWAVAIAKDEPEARKLVAKEYGYEPHEWGTLTICPLTKKNAFAVSGGG